jgi:hypothetical protein
MGAVNSAEPIRGTAEPAAAWPCDQFEPLLLIDIALGG